MPQPLLFHEEPGQDPSEPTQFVYGNGNVTCPLKGPSSNEGVDADVNADADGPVCIGRFRYRSDADANVDADADVDAGRQCFDLLRTRWQRGRPLELHGGVRGLHLLQHLLPLALHLVCTFVGTHHFDVMVAPPGVHLCARVGVQTRDNEVMTKS